MLRPRSPQRLEGGRVALEAGHEAKIFDPSEPVEALRSPHGAASTDAGDRALSRSPRGAPPGDRSPSPWRSPGKDGKGKGTSKGKPRKFGKGQGQKGKDHRANAEKFFAKRQERKLAASRRGAASGADH